MGGILNSITAWFQALPIAREWVAFLISMLPVVELRGGLPVARVMNIPYFKALIICMLGNFAPIPFILLLVIPIFNWLKKTRLFRGTVEKLENKTLSKKDSLEKGEFWGLMIFVGIPLPGTGAWTGALLAALLGIPFKKAVVSIFCGLLIAAAIMSFISYAIPFFLAMF